MFYIYELLQSQKVLKIQSLEVGTFKFIDDLNF